MYLCVSYSVDVILSSFHSSDNINTDIYGANLYNRYLGKREALIQRKKEIKGNKLFGMNGTKVDVITDSEFALDVSLMYHHLHTFTLHNKKARHSQTAKH